MGKDISQSKDELVQEAKQAAEGAKHAAERTRGKTWFHVLARIGYLVRGILYSLIGFLAVQLILSGRGHLEGRRGALEEIAQQPMGKPVLILMIVGLAGMVLWGLVRALADPDNYGGGPGGLLARVGMFISGLSYGALIIPTLSLLFGGKQLQDEGEQAQQAAAGVLGYPWGPWLVGAVGIALVVIGVNRIRNGLMSNIDERLKTYKMTRQQQKWAVRSGRMGAIAQGVVMMTIGALAILAAWTLDPNKVGGMDGALWFLATQPYGAWILGLVAAGLIAYAIYSITGALWFRVED